MYLHACTVQFVCTHMDVCITMYIYLFYMQVLNECLAVTEFVSCRLTSVYMYLPVQFVYTHTWTYACTMYIYILYMQVLNGCLAVTEFVSGRLTSVYMYLRACTVQFACTHMDVCMYNVHLYMQVLNGCLAVCVLQVDVCIHVSTCMYCLYVHTCTYACTMYIYILYMQVLNGCLAVTEFVSWRLTSVYMYLRACTVCMHTHGRMHVQCHRVR